MSVVILGRRNECRRVEVAVVVLDEIGNWRWHLAANRTLRGMKRIVLALLFATTAFAQQSLIEKDVRTLAADDMEGRGLGTKGIDKATSYLEGRMKAIGLEPVFGTSYRQQFPVKIGVSAGTNNRLGDVAAADWTPLGFSSAGAFDGQVAFVGYGISAPPLNYDDFAGIDLKGKVALMLRYEPQEKDDNSPFDGRKPSRWSAMRYKVLQARERGAVAVVFATGPLQDEGKDRVPPLANDGPESPAGIPVLQVKTSLAQKWVGDPSPRSGQNVGRVLNPSAAEGGRSAAADGLRTRPTSLAAFQKDVDKDLEPR